MINTSGNICLIDFGTVKIYDFSLHPQHKNIGNT